MLYKGKEYSDNEILEILNNKDNDILTYKEKLDGAETKIKTFENDITAKDETINELKIKNYDLLTKVTSLGYIGIRPVVVYPTLADRTVVCQGLVVPTVANIGDRLDNSPYA